VSLNFFLLTQQYFFLVSFFYLLVIPNMVFVVSNMVFVVSQIDIIMWLNDVMLPYILPFSFYFSGKTVSLDPGKPLIVPFGCDSLEQVVSVSAGTSFCGHFFVQVLMYCCTIFLKDDLPIVLKNVSVLK